MKEQNFKRYVIGENKSSTYFRLLLVCCLAFFSCYSVQAETLQQKTIKGKIVDIHGDAVIGANVSEKGTTNGVITDLDGQYSISVRTQNPVLKISYIGYLTQEVTIGNRTEINITLAEDTQQLDEVVVVGFGTQKKVNLTGAVGMTDSKTFDSRPVQNAVQALQGVVPGLNISQSSGEVGATSDINIRGIATIGDGSSGQPLILIDGMEGDINNVNPQDIENISVLKDASASSIYGSRAPFGVILITTKSGRVGRATINYSNNFRLDNPANLPKLMDSYKFALYFNDAAVNGGQTVWFKPEHVQRIQDYQNGTLKTTLPTDPGNPLLWANSFVLGNANTDWYDELYKKWVLSQEHNLSISGGKEDLSYYLSGNFLDKNGFINFGGDDYNRYTLSAKINARLTKFISVNYSSRFVREKTEKPYYLDSNFYYALGTQCWPTQPVTDPNGYFFSSSGPNHAHLLSDGGRYKRTTDQIAQQVQVVLAPLDGWKIFAEGNFRKRDFNQNVYQLPLYNHDVNGDSYWYYRNTTSFVEEQAYTYNYLGTNIYTEYRKSLGDHNLKGLLGFQAEEGKEHHIKAKREGIMIAGLPTLNTTSGTNTSGSAVPPVVYGQDKEWATVGFFGRVNYDYKGRYLLEGNLRYDGSSRFRGDDRWKLFPSFSMGWNIAREDFWKPIEDKVNTLKFRASYGSLGNQNTTEWYPTYMTMPVKMAEGTWLLNGVKPNIANAPGLISSRLSWEKINTWNFGADVGALNNRLTASFDYFVRKTLDMIGPAKELPAILGTGVPKFNNTDLKTYGFELQIAWNDRLKNGLGYGVRFSLSDSQTEITSYPNETGNLDPKLYRDNMKMGEIWGYRTAGIAKTQEEMDNHLAKLPNGGQNKLGSQWGAGDIMFVDLNGDGKIDDGANTFSNHGDLEIIGNSTPRYAFGLDMNADWKGFDFRIFFQGIMKRDIFKSRHYFWGVYSDMWSSMGLTEHEDYFRGDENHPLGQNLDSFYPRPLFGNTKNLQTQTKYLQKASYIRLKNIQLGYTLPKSVIRKIAIQKLRVFVSAENLWTGTGLTKIFDPETVDGGWNGNSYPLTSTVSFGLNVNF